MAREIRVQIGETGAFGSIGDYSVREEATSLTIGDTSGGAGTIGFATSPVRTGPLARRSLCRVGEDFVITDRTSYDDQTYATGSTIGPVQRTNLASYPQGEVAAAANQIGWRRNRWFNGGSGVYETINLAVGEAPLSRITKAVRKRWVTASTGSGDTGFGHTDAGTAAFPVTPGQVYTVSSYLRASIAVPINMYRAFYNGNTTAIGGATTSAMTSVPGQWHRLSATFTVPAGVQTMTIISDADGGIVWPVGGTLDGTGLLVELSADLSQYFDGETPDTSVDAFDWVAGPGSASTLAPVLTAYAPKVVQSSVSGRVTSVSMPGGMATYDAETILTRLNVNREAKAHYGTATGDSVSTSERTNLAVNPGFEVNVSNVVFTVGGGVTTTGTVTREDGGSDTGSYVARLTITADQASAATNGGGISYRQPVTAGQAYGFNMPYRVARAAAVEEGQNTQLVRMYARFENASNASVGVALDETRIVKQGVWENMTLGVPATAPVGATSIVFQVFNFAGTGANLWKVGDIIDIDNVTVENDIPGPYFDGSFQDVTVPGEVDGTSIRTRYAWLGPVGASASRQYIDVITAGRPYDATVGTAFRYYCGLVNIENVTVSAEFERIPVTYQSWEGNVLDHVKQMAAAVGGEIALVNGTPTLRKPRLIEIPVESIESAVLSVDNQTDAQWVEVQNYNTSWGNDLLVTRHDAPISVNAGEHVQMEIQTEHSLESVNNPVVVDTIDLSYTSGTGQYAVVDSQGAQVPAATWRSLGGSVTARLSTADPHVIVVTIRGIPDRGALVGPYRLARIQDEDDYGSLVLTGSGVFVDPKTHRIRTGVPKGSTANETATTIDNLFINDKNTARTLGVNAACRAAGSAVKLTGKLNRHALRQEGLFGLIAGARIKLHENAFRITTATITAGQVDFVAVNDALFSDFTAAHTLTFADFNTQYSGFTFADFNALWAGKTFGEFNASIPPKSFADFNAIYEGALFRDFNIYPLIEDVIPDAVPSL